MVVSLLAVTAVAVVAVAQSAAVVVVVSVVLLSAVVFAAAIKPATLKPAISRRNSCLCVWAVRFQLRHDRRRLRQLSEVRATLSAPFDVNEGTWSLRKRGCVHVNLLGWLMVDVALDHQYRSSRVLSSLRLAHARVMTLYDFHRFV
jgi:hypothetical protein